MSIKPVDFDGKEFRPEFFDILYSFDLLSKVDRVSAMFGDFDKFLSRPFEINENREIFDRINLFDEIAKIEEGRDELISKIAFDRYDWFKYFGYVGIEPLLPENILEILNSPCPIWGGGKKVSDTHLLILVPSEVNGQPLTLNSLGKLIQHPKEGYATKYRFYWDKIQKRISEKSPRSSYWVLFSKDVIPNSRSKEYLYQKELVSDLSSKAGINYKLPFALEAAVCILMHHVRTEERLYNDSPFTWTRCQEMVKRHYPLAIGGFSSKGLTVDDGIHKYYCSGVAVVRKL